MDDILYDPLFFVFEVPNVTSGGNVLGVSYDGNNFEFATGGTSSVESINVFIN